MAARNPSNFTQYIDENALVAGKVIKLTGPDETLDDLEYVLDCEQLGITDCFRVRRVTYAADANNWVEIARYYLNLKDMCDEKGVSASGIFVEWCAYCWGDGTRIPGVKVTTTSGLNNSTNTGAASATPGWSDFGHTLLRVVTQNAEDTITLFARVEPPGAAGQIYCAGLGLFVSVT